MVSPPSLHSAIVCQHGRTVSHIFCIKYNAVATLKWRSNALVGSGPTAQAPYVYAPEQAAHPALAGSRDLQAFLEANEEEWGAEMGRAGHDGASSMHSAMGGGGGGNAAQKAMASTLQKLKSLGHQTQSLVSGKHADEEEDPEYLKASPFLRRTLCRAWCQCLLQSC